MKRKIKVQFIINSLTSGGAEKLMTMITGKLAETKKVDINLIIIEKDVSYKINRKIKLRVLSKLSLRTNKIKKMILLPFVLLKYIKITKEERPDLIISFLEISNFFAILTGKFLKIPVIATVHIDLNKQYSEGGINKIIKKISKVLYPKATKIIAVSKSIKEELIREFNIDPRKVETIYNPVEIEKEGKLSKQKLSKQEKKIFEDSFIFINIGRLTEQKGHWFLIRAFKKVNEKYPYTKLIILGEGELKKQLQKLINRLKLENKVFLLGFQKNPYKFLARSKCFVLSSLWEGFGIVIVEALALNKPIISSDCKFGPREILSEISINKRIKYPYKAEYGVLVKPFPRQFIWKNLKEQPLNQEEQQLTNTMIKMIENKNLRKKYSNGSKRAKDFDIEKIIKEWKNVIKTETIQR